MQQIEDFLNYCEQELEQQGKDDALINIDSSFMFDNMKVIAQEAVIMLMPVKLFYEGYITTMNAKIENLKRFGLVDTVEDLSSQRKIAERELQQCLDFDAHLTSTLTTYNQGGDYIRKLDWGVAQKRMSSYARGFQKGLIDTIN